MGRIKGWKKVGEDTYGIIWETKKRSKVYKGQPKLILSVIRHPIYSKYWTIDTGQAPISMPKIRTKKQAINYAKIYMKKYPRG